MAIPTLRFINPFESQRQLGVPFKRVYVSQSIDSLREGNWAFPFTRAFLDTLQIFYGQGHRFAIRVMWMDHKGPQDIIIGSLQRQAPFHSNLFQM
jgi:hypothetical protein